MPSINISNILIITVRNVDYRFIVNSITNFKAIYLLEYCGYLQTYYLKFNSIKYIFSYLFVYFLIRILAYINVPDYLKTKKIFKHVVKKLPYLLRKALYEYKMDKNCDKAILENVGTFKYVPECYITKEICYRAVHRWVLEFCFYS